MAHPSQDAVADTPELDQQVLDLRQTGKSFASIAKSLKLGNTRDANAAFLRAVRVAKPAQRKKLREAELVRLQKLEDRVRAAEDLAPFDRDKQLDTIKFLRKQLLA